MKLTLKLFICGMTRRSEQAISNLRAILEEHKDTICDLSIIDVLDWPDLAEHHRIIVTPTLLKEAPPPGQVLAGDLSDIATVKRLLGLQNNTSKRNEPE